MRYQRTYRKTPRSRESIRSEMRLNRGRTGTCRIGRKGQFQKTGQGQDLGQAERMSSCHRSKDAMSRAQEMQAHCGRQGYCFLGGQRLTKVLL